MVRRLVSRRLFLDRDYEQWRNVISGEIVRITRCTSLPESLTKLCAYLNVPQRCLVAVSELSFTITYFQGKTCPGTYPCNSYLWEQHCGVCDDLLHYYTRRECFLCSVHCCRRCLVDAQCWPCVTEDAAYQPRCLRDELLNEAYERLEGMPQPTNHQDYDVFPFVEPCYRLDGMHR